MEIACPVCATDAPSTSVARRGDGLVIKHCPNCGLLFVSPRPTEESLSKLYSTYFASHRKVEVQEEEYWQKILRSQYSIPSSDPRIYFLKSQNVSIRGLRILDIGSGDASFLLKCRKQGASSVAGVEPDASMARATTNHLGIPVHAGYLDTFPEDMGPFDLITLWDVLEHLPDPGRTLKLAHGRLAKNGSLAAITPNAGRFEVEGTKWVGFRVDFEHMSYYSALTARQLFEASGFKLRATQEYGWPNLEEAIMSGRDLGIKTRIVRDLLWRFRALNPLVMKITSAKEVLANEGRNRRGRYHLCLLADKR